MIAGEGEAMRLRSLIVVPGLCAAALILTAPAAMASYSGDGGVTISPSTPSAGGDVTIDSSGWMTCRWPWPGV